MLAVADSLGLVEERLGALRLSTRYGDWITHQGGNRNLVALLHSALTLPSTFIEDAVEEIEDMALVAAMRASKREYTTREAVMDVLEGRSCASCNGATSTGSSLSVATSSTSPS